MGCPGLPCTPVQPVGSWTFNGDPTAPRFCDTRLVGLAPMDASQGFSLPILNPVTGCLGQPSAPRGVYQHDESKCFGDFIGPLENPDMILKLADPGKSHSLIVLEQDCGNPSGPGNPVRLIPKDSQYGMPSLLRPDGCNDTGGMARLSPVLLINSRQGNTGACVSPRMLGYLPVTREVDGRTVTEHVWFALTKWQQATVDAVVNSDILLPNEGQTANITITGWRTETCPNGGSVRQLVEFPADQIQRTFPRGMVHKTPWHTIGEQNMDFTASQILFSFIPSALPEFNPNFKTMWLRTEVKAGTLGRDYRLRIRLKDQDLHDGYLRTNGIVDNADFINPTYVFPYPILVPGEALTLTKILDFLPPDVDTNPVTNMEYKLSLVGWDY